MANLHTNIPTTGERAQEIRNLVRQTRNASNEASRLVAIFQTYGAPTEYEALRVEIGVGTVGEAQAIYELLLAAQGRLTGAQISNFVDRLG